MDFQEFPKCLYRGDEPLIVANEHEEAAARSGGFRFWSDADAPAEAPETVESLRAKLDALGIKYDQRFGVAKLAALLPQ